MHATLTRWHFVFLSGPPWLRGLRDHGVMGADSCPRVMRPTIEHNVNETSVVSFIHIGKTGGDSILWALRKLCVPPRCTLRHQIHLHPPRPCSFVGVDAVIISVRDPLDRAVSSFNWRHPQGGSRVVASEPPLSTCMPPVLMLTRVYVHAHASAPCAYPFVILLAS
mgnify:CR=1 FL=1